MKVHGCVCISNKLNDRVLLLAEGGKLLLTAATSHRWKTEVFQNDEKSSPDIARCLVIGTKPSQPALIT